MPVKIRLTRIGARKRPFYRVVAVDERHKRTGGYLELLGTYNPLTEPKEIKLKQDRIDHWLKQGAQPSEGFLRIIGKAPQRPARKPKKAPAEKPAEAAVAPKKEAVESETQAEEPETTTETATAETVTESPAEETTTETPTEEAPAETPVEDKPESEPETPVEAAEEPAETKTDQE